MSPSIISLPTIFLTCSILVLLSTSISPVQCRNLALAQAPTSANPMLQLACSDSLIINSHVCLGVLESIPKVASAKDLASLAIAIIESGISNSTDTRTHIEAAFNGSDAAAGVKSAFNDCKLAYDQVVDRFGDALTEVKIHEYAYPSYDLLTASTDYVKLCDAALASHNLHDEVISRGNNAVPIFGLSACSIVAQLENQSRFAPPGPGPIP
ncbi:hypothetical protein C2S53_006478 [Perilla frutescens var. hirtella]|uniref:Pectinesterase inhibitor domain-containing protein n=1 Tax=Perilla frutescens var. hirtella TaxID=608512 RepID=A0AAD4NZY1_PERFH|nr:hypothetical protein C2S53_006478 [Perilla frutescens var. hirtella]